MAPATDPEASIGLAMEAGLQQKAQHVTASLRRIFFFLLTRIGKETAKRKKNKRKPLESYNFSFSKEEFTSKTKALVHGRFSMLARKGYRRQRQGNKEWRCLTSSSCQ
jgi:hypothetical protein